MQPLPRITISPTLAPSAGTGFIVSVFMTSRPSRAMYRTPCLALSRDRCSIGSDAGQCSDERVPLRSHIILLFIIRLDSNQWFSPYYSNRYLKNRKANMEAFADGGGAAPAVFTCTTWGRGRMASSGDAFTIELRTTGAAQKWVTLYLAMAAYTALAVTCVIAVYLYL